jgi:hypothetical protein
MRPLDPLNPSLKQPSGEERNDHLHKNRRQHTPATAIIPQGRDSLSRDANAAGLSQGFVTTRSAEAPDVHLSASAQRAPETFSIRHSDNEAPRPSYLPSFN